MLGQSLVLRRWAGLTDTYGDDASLRTVLWRLPFDSPLGVAAGFDKNGQIVDGLLDMGFSFVEIGSVTPKPQPGNPKPRLFRLEEDEAVVNRFGFNSDGYDAVFQRLAKRMENFKRRQGWVGVNLGKNKEATDPIGDYCQGIEKFWTVADYFVVNVSSPNTPGLRDLQAKNQLRELLSAVRAKVDAEYDSRVLKSFPKGGIQCETCVPPKPALLVKIAPDLPDEQFKKDIAEAVLEIGVDGIIVSNTTIDRPNSLLSEKKKETGGLSGRPLFDPSTELLRDMYRLTDGKVVLIGVGGISDGRHAYAKVRWFVLPKFAFVFSC
jgi:dihydroorotate dehydrogenase